MRFLSTLILSLAFTGAFAGNPVSWSFSAAPGQGDTVLLRLTATCQPGWHIYALTLPSDEGPLPTVITMQEGKNYKLLGAVSEPVPEGKDDTAFGMKVRFHTGTVGFTQKLLRKDPEAFTVTGKVEYMTCNGQTCLPPATVPIQLKVPASK